MIKAPRYSIDIKTDTPKRVSVFLCYFLISTNTSSGRLNILGTAINVDGFQSPLLPGFAVGMLACVIVSLLDKAPGKEVTDIFDRAISKYND